MCLGQTVNTVVFNVGGYKSKYNGILVWVVNRVNKLQVVKTVNTIIFGMGG